MNQLPLFYLAVLLGLLYSCSKTELPIQEPLTAVEDDLLSTSLCLPPFTVDTSNIQMQMLIDDVPYQPLGNFSCILPNLFLGIDQIWINGSTPPALKVITIMVPVDVQAGTYNLALNSSYDVRYVPSGNINFSVDAGTLVITHHDIDNQMIEGGFEFIATNLDSPVQPQKEFTKGCFRAHYEQ